jgi:hypothetical protein
MFHAALGTLGARVMRVAEKVGDLEDLERNIELIYSNFFFLKKSNGFYDSCATH